MKTVKIIGVLIGVIILISGIYIGSKALKSRTDDIKTFKEIPEEKQPNSAKVTDGIKDSKDIRDKDEHANSEDDSTNGTISIDTKNLVLGNSISNIVNGGIVTEKDGWVYYSDTSKEYQIFKMREDGTQKSKFYNEKGRYLNVVGEWLYYSNADDESKLYKIRLDGTGKTKLNDDVSFRVIVINDTIFYSNNSDNDEYGTLYSISVNGTQKRKLTDSLSYLIGIDDNDIYYMKRVSSGDGFPNFKLYSIRINDNYGFKRRELTKDFVGNAVMINNDTYYSSYNKIAKLEAYDNLDDEAIVEAESLELNSDDKNIFYVKVNPDMLLGDYYVAGPIYKLDAEGKTNTRLTNDNASDISIIGGWVYYNAYIGKDGNYTEQIYRIMKDGTHREKVS